MIKRIIAFILPAISFSAMAQNVGVGTNSPHASAILDVNSTTRGLLIPRMAAVTEINITNPEKGLLIYQTNQQRFRYNAGTALSKNFVNILMWDDALNGFNQYWKITGTNTSPALRFYGTTNPQDFVLKVNNQQVARFGHNTYNVALGLQAGLFAYGGYNIFIGRRTSWVNHAGVPLATINQIAIGDSALHLFKRTPSATSSYNGYNIAIGTKAQGSIENGVHNIALGHYSMEYLEANSTNTNIPTRNIAIGQNSLSNEFATSNNVAIGTRALDDDRSGSVTAVGNNARISLGNYVAEDPYNSYNTLLGSDTKLERVFSNVSAIGREAKALGTPTEDLQNLMVFGNLEVTKWAFGRSTTDANVALQVGTNNTNGNGAYLTRTGTWTNVSDRNKKEDFTPINTQNLLQQLESLPITRWQYKTGGGWHIGPMAQDFKAIFNLGSADNKAINTVDPVGIALAAAQALLAETELLKKRTTALEVQLHQ